MGGYSSFVDRFRVFQRLTAGPRAVTATRQVVAALPMCAEGNDPQLLRRLWDIGAAGLKDSKLGWPGLQNPGAHFCISKIMRERRPRGGCWALLSSLLQGASSAHVAPAPGANVALGGAPSSAAAAGGGRGGGDGRGGGGGGAHRAAHGAGGGNVGPGSSASGLQELVGDGHVQVRQRLQLQPPMTVPAERVGAREAVGPLWGCSFEWSAAAMMRSSMKLWKALMPRSHFMFFDCLIFCFLIV